MNPDEVHNYFKNFINSYEEEKKNAVWTKQSNHCITFLNQLSKRNNDQNEIDQIIRYLDKQGKGSTPTTEAIAKVMVPQGSWYQIFEDIANNKDLKNNFDSLMLLTDRDKRKYYINNIYKTNQGNKNHLTGTTASAINAFLALFDP